MDMRLAWPHMPRRIKMGCNCSKDQTTLSLKKRLRKEMKQKIADVKRIWNESANKVTSDKNDLGFKPIEKK